MISVVQVMSAHGESRAPAVLTDVTRDMVCSWPDASLVLWSSSSTLARNVLSDREQAHAAKLLGTDSDYTAAARYLRQQLTSGDHVQARARINLDVGAWLTLGGLRYKVTGRRGEYVTTLTGERNGKADLCRPFAGRHMWWLCRPGLGQPGNKIEGYRRDDATGAFTAAK